MTDNWSDAPIVADGVTITPRCPISPQQRRDVEAQQRALGRPDKTPKETELKFLAYRREVFSGECSHPDESMSALGCSRCGALRPDKHQKPQVVIRP